jgi:molybdenum cofactor cytidylyltransferase
MGGGGIGLVLLAAGSATRMGTAKQLLPYRGRSLLRHAAEAAVGSGLTPVVVVLGARAEQLRPELGGLPVLVAVNDAWERGMGTSVRVGLAALRAAAPDAAGVVFTLCDQPLAGPDVIRRLVASHRETRRPVVASEYGGTLGVPALFAREYFPDLEGLADGEGAKQVIVAAAGGAHAVPFPDGALDVDSPEDYERLCAAEWPGQPGRGQR